MFSWCFPSAKTGNAKQFFLSQPIGSYDRGLSPPAVKHQAPRNCQGKSFNQRVNTRLGWSVRERRGVNSSLMTESCLFFTFLKKRGQGLCWELSTSMESHLLSWATTPEGIEMAHYIPNRWLPSSDGLNNCFPGHNSITVLFILSPDGRAILRSGVSNEITCKPPYRYYMRTLGQIIFSPVSMLYNIKY